MCLLCHKLNLCLKVKEDYRPLNHVSCLLSAKTFALVMLQLLLRQTVNESLICAHNVVTPVKSARQALRMGRWVLQGKAVFFLHVSKATFYFFLLGELAQKKSLFHWDQNSSLIASVIIIIFLLTGILHNCCEAYNVGLLEAKIFSGPSREQFGYAVQQFVNEQGKW